MLFYMVTFRKELTDQIQGMLVTIQYEILFLPVCYLNT
jgi:hypothetical protein